MKYRLKIPDMVRKEDVWMAKAIITSQTLGENKFVDSQWEYCAGGFNFSYLPKDWLEPIEDSAADITQRVFDDMGLDHHDMMEFGRRCVKAGQNDYKERHKPKQTFEEMWENGNGITCPDKTLWCGAGEALGFETFKRICRAAEKNRGYDETNSGD